jgi:hypothetical protein
MILNFEISEETGALLDAIAKTEDRSRRAQAARILRDAIHMIASDLIADIETEEEAQ